MPPFGVWAERTVVPSEEVWDVPDDVDDRTAITIGIAGTGAFVPLEQANIQPGETVLILGATGALGQLGLQLARHLRAGRVVGASRDKRPLLDWRSAASPTQPCDLEQVTTPLRSRPYPERVSTSYSMSFAETRSCRAQGDSIRCSHHERWRQAGPTANVNLGDMLFRTHTCVGTGQRSPQDRHSIWERLLGISREAGITMDCAIQSLEEAPQAWAAQASSPHAKIIATI